MPRGAVNGFPQDKLWLKLTPENLKSIDVRVQPFTYNLVGKPFEIGDSPKVNAQFSIQYCVASALLRKSSRLVHFDPEQIREPNIMEIVKKISVTSDPDLNDMDIRGMAMKVQTTHGAVYDKNLPTCPGAPGYELSKAEHIARFDDCVSYAGKPLAKETSGKIISIIEKLEELEDVRDLISVLVN